jgi:hypothetical protein
LEKIKVYVYSLKVSTLNFVDKEGAQHACAQAGSTPFSGLKHYPGAMDDRYISEEEKKAIIAVENFCARKGYEFEVIDLATASFFTKIKLKARGLMNFPAVSYKGKVIHGVPTEGALIKLVGNTLATNKTLHQTK